MKCKLPSVKPVLMNENDNSSSAKELIKYKSKFIAKNYVKNNDKSMSINSLYTRTNQADEISIACSNTELYPKTNDNVFTSRDILELNGSLSNSESSCNIRNKFLDSNKQLESISHNDLTFTGKFSSCAKPSTVLNQQLSSNINFIDTVIIDSSNSSESSILWDKSSLDETNSYASKSNHGGKFFHASENSLNEAKACFFSFGKSFDANSDLEKYTVTNNTPVRKERKKEVIGVDNDLFASEEQVSVLAHENMSYLDAKQKNALVRSTNSKKVKTTQEILAVIQNKKHLNAYENENAVSVAELSSK